MSRISIGTKQYKPILDLMHTEIAINEVKDYFENKFSESLNLIKISAPLLLSEGKEINDHLNDIERIVSFNALDIKNTKIEMVQSLAKWKRIALLRYGFTIGEGLYTNMNAVRRDEKLDHIHSIYVDQWDWEKVITKESRTKETLLAEVRRIYNSIKLTESYMYEFHPMLKPVLPEEIFFISSQELESILPNLTPREREDQITREHGAVFIMQIGSTLFSGEKHDVRSPDYDDWSLNGDILFWNPLLERAFEISSMGIRVDAKTLLNQLILTKNEDRKGLDYHQSILNENLPFSIGGGIGQSRLCMFLLKKAHIGEVQASVWTDRIRSECVENNISLL